MVVQGAMERRKNLTRTAYEEIRAAIYNNKVKQGDLLSESALAQELEMSRTPVREALRMLASEDLIEVKNGIEIYVKPISYRDICDLFEVRRSLEILAARTAICEITDAEIEYLEKRFHAFLAQQEAGVRTSLEEFSAVDWELHELFVDRCRNKHLQQIVKGIHSNLKRYQSVSFEA